MDIETIEKMKHRLRLDKALLLAVKSKEMNEVVQEVKKGADVNLRYNNGNTLLHLSMNCDTTSYLIRKGADVNATNCHGETPLHLSVQAEDHELMNTLLMHNADTSIENDDGWTPLMNYFDKKPSWKEEIIETLLNYESNVNRVNCDGATILSKALVEKSPYLKNIIQHGGNFSSLLHDTMVLRWCASRLVKFEDFKWFWDIYEYDAWNYDESILEYLLQKSEYSKFEYIIQSTKLKDIVSTYKIPKRLFKQGYLITKILLEINFGCYSKNKAEEAIYILLSHGYVPSENEAIEVFKTFGYSPLFTLLLHLDVKKTYFDSQFNFGSLMPKILLNPDLCITVVTKLCTRTRCRITKSSRRVTSYISDERLVQFIEIHSPDRFSHNLLRRVRQRQLPSLLELSRNQVRIAIWKGCKPQNTRQFYSVVEWMKIPQLIKDVITLKIPVYDLPLKNTHSRLFSIC